MVKKTFYEGQALSSITLSPAPNDYICVGGMVKSITVVMENGQMASVPWAFVEVDNGQHGKYNLSQVLGVGWDPEVIEDATPE